MLMCNGAFCIFLLVLVGKTSFVKGCWFWEYECRDGGCFTAGEKCDGVRNCKDGSDEENCGDLSVAKTSITRSTGSTDADISNSPAMVTASVIIGSSPVHIQTTKDGSVTIRCKDRGYGSITWYKSDGGDVLQEGSQVREYLILRKIKCKDAGTYVCFRSSDPRNLQRYGVVKLHVKNCRSVSSSTEVYATVNQSSSTTVGLYNPGIRPPAITEGYNPITRHFAVTTQTNLPTLKVPCSNNTVVNGTCCHLVCSSSNCNTPPPPRNDFKCNDGTSVPLSSKCNGKKDCRDGSDELDCQRTCKPYEFRCRNGTCIPGPNYCDGEIDCPDASDERDCTGILAPKITELPKSTVEVDCLEEDKSSSGSHLLQLECKFAGKPTPTVKWKKYEGHVAPNCVQISLDGHGILKCPDFQQTDQGAYSCVAENIAGSAESQPKSIAKCRQFKCDRGFMVADEHNIETCLECFCSGKDVKCKRIQSELVTYNFEFPAIRMDLLVKQDGEISFPNDTNVNAVSFQRIKYCSIPEEIVSSHSFIESYGRNLNIPSTHAEKSNYLPNAPDVIIRGNGIMLMYSFNKISHTSSRIDIRFWKGNWFHNDKRVASRHDIMTVLAHLDLILLRCEYEENNVVRLNPESGIILESSKVSDGSKSVSYLEKCNCPKEYTGLSCQICAPGFERDTSTSDFVCKPKTVIPKFCPLGSKRDDCDCDTRKLHYLSFKNKTCELSKCTNIGSIGRFPDNNDNCICKERVSGKYCDTCKKGFFYLDVLNPLGCKKCWCNNVTTECRSSKWFKTTISSTSWGGYNASSGGNFWLLPPEFSGNRLSSYGGFLRYKLKYAAGVAKQPKPLAVEILSANDISIKYTDSNIDEDKSRTEKSWNVPIEEPFWRDNLNLIVTRERLMQILVNIKAIYVESPYHLSSDLVKMTRVDLDVAEDMSNYAEPEDGGEIASKVEQCACPVGYEGLSCELCSDGYYKKRNEVGGYECKPCDCADCDPERGCIECKKGEYQDNPGALDPPICLKCPCNGNEEYCQKDQMGQVICFCKTGFLGIYCESHITASHLRVTITPSKVVNKEVGTVVTFNCSYDSTEEMQISFQKKYSVNHDETALQNFRKIENYGSVSIMEITIEDDLIAIDCIVRNKNNEEKGRVSAGFIGTVTKKIKPKITNCYEEPPQVIENEDLQLICEANGDPEPSITWYIMKETVSEKLDTINGVYTISSASLTQNNTNFLCVAENSAGDDKCSTRVIVKKRCDVLSVIPSNLVIYEGQTAEFSCTTTSQAKVTWFFSDGALPSEAEVYDGRLAIKHASLLHSGNYTCSSKGSDGPLVKSVNLSVMKERMPPRAVIKQEDMVVNIGNSVEINCDVSGYPVPQVTWRKIGSLFLPANAYVTDNGLTLKQVTRENDGFYECRAESGPLASTSRIHVLVPEKPEIRIKPEKVTAKEGDSFEIECEVLRGDPAPEIAWTDLATYSVISHRKTLKFSNSDVYSSGKYECKANNLAGAAVAVAEVTIGRPARISRLIPSGEVFAVVGDTFNIECIVEGSPKPTIKWVKWQKINNLSNRIAPSPKLLPESDTKIIVTATQDLSKIECEAENSFGKANKSVTFNVQGGRNPYSDTVIRVHIGSRVQLIFKELNNVAKCRRKHSSLIGDECYIKNGLEIASVQVQHNGTYICVSDTGEERSSDIIVVGFVNKFNKLGRSYLRLPLTVKSSAEFSVEVTFKADNGTGLILLKKYHEFSMYLFKSKLKVRLQRSSNEIVILEPGVELKLEVWYTAIFKLHKSAELSIYDDQGIKLDRAHKMVPFQMGWRANYEDDLYVGGVRLSGIKLPLKWIESPFGGCISRLIIDDHEYMITEEATYSKNVSLCNICSSPVDPCGSEGVCYNAPTQYGYICVCGKEGNKCPRSCNGLGCSTKHDICKLVKPCHGVENQCVSSGTSLQCNCGAGYSGITCKDEVALRFSFKQEGYVKLPPYYLPRHSLHDVENITINFVREPSSHGLLLFQRHKRNYLYIYAEHHNIKYIYHNQGKTLTVTGPMSLNPFFDDINVEVAISRRNNTVLMTLRGTTYKGETDFSTNRVWGEIYIGGIPADLEKEISSWFPEKLKGFLGCINSIKLGNGDPVNVLAEDVVRRNVRRTCRSMMKNNSPELAAYSSVSGGEFDEDDIYDE